MLLTIKKCFVSSQYLSEQTARPVVFMTTVYFSNNACKNALLCVFFGVFFFMKLDRCLQKKLFRASLRSPWHIRIPFTSEWETFPIALSSRVSPLCPRALFGFFLFSHISPLFQIAKETFNRRFPHVSQLNHPWIHNCLSIFLLQNDRQEKSFPLLPIGWKKTCVTSASLFLYVYLYIYIYIFVRNAR